MADLIVIPARYGSQRLPGKPLLPVAGRLLVERVVAVAVEAAARLGDTDVAVATDDDRIAAAAAAMGVVAVMTDQAIATGSARALAAADALGKAHALVINLQGDAPFTDPAHVVEIVKWARASGADVTTPVVRLDWAALDALRAAKLQTPASGTCCIRAPDGRALWFSKAVIPFMRDEVAMRVASHLSPVLQHIGLYCYRRAALEAFAIAAPSAHELTEGLEQLRLIELGLDVRAVEVTPAAITMSGIDSPADVVRAEALIATHGDPFRDWRSIE